MDQQLDSWFHQLSRFVKQVCENRKPSHGYEHMLKVTRNAVLILNAEQTTPVMTELLQKHSKEKIAKLVFAVAFLHDVPDHKYDHDGLLQTKVVAFLQDFGYSLTEAYWILQIIKNISFSNEDKALKRGLPLNFVCLLSPLGAMVRDIVSDADKLEAIGKEGLQRCEEYTIEVYKEHHNNQDPPKEYVCTKVKEHAQEKLLRLADEFIRTNTGKRLARPKHDEMKECLLNCYSE